MTYYAHSSEGICKGYKQFGKAGRVADRLKSPDLLAEWLSNSFVARQKHLPNVSDVKVLEWKGKLTEKLRECNILPRPNSLCWSQLKDNSMCHLGGPCVCQSGDTGEGEISDINKQTILPFKGIHLGRKAILLASGPTLDAFFTSKVQSLLNHSIVAVCKRSQIPSLGKSASRSFSLRFGTAQALVCRVINRRKYWHPHPGQCNYLRGQSSG
mmetsp:Transcript_66416/g.210210  ORF Transcript_66416/g.210210 Transcript_66416/m.210210 type:complete len:212 (-) Transcript_66416:101-736(-)